MSSIRATFALFALLALFVPASVSAASVNIITREIRTSSGLSVPVTPATIPTLSVGETKGGSGLALSYRNMPLDAYFVIVRARDNRLASGWNFPADIDADGQVNAAIPLSLARGTYALRALDPISKLLHAESGTFRSNGRGTISLVSRSHQEASLRIFTGTRNYAQTLGLTRAEAKKECKKVERANRDEDVICIWGDRII